jgi:hypothetical protein
VPSSPPDDMDYPVITLQNSDTFIKITWSNPRNNGAVINKYLIEIKQADGSYSEYTPTCDAVNDATIVS